MPSSSLNPIAPFGLARLGNKGEHFWFERSLLTAKCMNFTADLELSLLDFRFEDLEDGGICAGVGLWLEGGS